MVSLHSPAFRSYRANDGRRQFYRQAVGGALLVVALLSPALAAEAQVPTPSTTAATSTGTQAPGMEVTYYKSGATNVDFEPKVMATTAPAAGSTAEVLTKITSGPAATFVVNYDAGFVANVSAQASFQAGIDIWAATLTSAVPIVVDARLTTQSCGGAVFTPGVLGSAGPTTVFTDFTGAPFASTFYPSALGNALAGSDLDPSGTDICAAFNQGETNLYFGTDSNPPFDKYDFTSIVLHELGHGLGFIGSMRKDAADPTKGTCCSLGEPFVYDLFTTRGNGTSLLSFIPAPLFTPSVTLMTQLTSNDIFFRGTNTNAAAGIGGAKLYSPSPIESGSTYSHLDESTYPCAPAGVGCTGANSLMTPSITSGEVEHQPGPIMLGMFQDMGWQFATASVHFSVTATTPTVAGMPSSFTVTARDALNAVVTGYAGTAHFTTTSTQFSLPADSTLVNGTATFPATLRTAGNQTISASDTAVFGIVGTSNAIVVNAAAATLLNVAAPSQMVAGTPGNITVNAVDAFGNTATGYFGTVHFTTTSAASNLPADSVLTSGVGTFSATLSTAGTKTITATDTVNLSITGVSAVITVGPGSGFHALPPARILDTRLNIGITNAVGTTAKDLTALGVGGIPGSSVSAILLNVTVTGGFNNSFLTVFPSGTTVPNASNLNFASGETIPNLVVVKLGTAGKVSFVNALGTTHVVGDVVGWYDDSTITGDHYVGVAPVRTLDTRINLGITGKVSAAAQTLNVSGVSGVPAVGVTAVVINVTATGASNNSFLTAFPTGGATPNSSNLNFAQGQTIPNLVVVKLGSGGQINFVNAVGTTDVVGDVLGYFTATDPGGGFLALAPSRVLDTRLNMGIIGKVDTTAKTLTIGGVGGVPVSGVSAVVINVTVTGGSNSSFLTAFPGGTTVPVASNLNFGTGQTIPNLVVVKVGAGGTVNFVNAVGSADVIADVVGWYTT